MPQPPILASRPRATRLAGVAAALVLAAGLGACASDAPASFDAASPCTVDQQVAGAYPDLEARVPGMLFGVAPESLDSGRKCTPKGLGTLAARGVAEVRFAGATWARGDRAGVSTAVFAGDGVTAEAIGEFYEAGARSATRTGSLRPSRPTIDGRQGYRLDLVVDDQPETVVAWPSADGSVVQVVLGVGVAEPDLEEAIAAFE